MRGREWLAPYLSDLPIFRNPSDRESRGGLHAHHLSQAHQHVCPPFRRKYRRCRCPIWPDGFLGREELRKSRDTRDWEKAQGIIREWEAEGSLPPDTEPVTVAQ